MMHENISINSKSWIKSLIFFYVTFRTIEKRCANLKPLKFKSVARNRKVKMNLKERKKKSKWNVTEIKITHRKRERVKTASRKEKKPNKQIKESKKKEKIHENKMWWKRLKWKEKGIKSVKMKT